MKHPLQARCSWLGFVGNNVFAEPKFKAAIESGKSFRVFGLYQYDFAKSAGASGR